METKPFLLPLLMLAACLVSCTKLAPTGFWKNDKRNLLTESTGDQGPYGGHRAMHWKADEPHTFDSAGILRFAVRAPKPSMMKNDVDNITCLTCNKLIAVYGEDTDTFTPTPEECHRAGKVAVPNAGWFCSQACAIQFEKDYDLRFARTDKGIIDYYPEVS